MTIQPTFRKAGKADSALYRAAVAIHQRARSHEDPLVDMMIRAAQAPTSMANTPELVTVMTEFVESLTPYSAAAALFALSLNLSFGNAGMLSLPTVSATPQAVWIREGAPIPVALGLSSAVSLTPFKMATLVALSNEMMRSSQAEAVMRQTILNALGPALDLALFAPTPGVPGLNPPGLLDGVAITPPSAAPSLAEAMVQDMQNLVDAIAAYGGNGNIAFIASPKLWVRMTKTDLGSKGFPVLIAGNLTNTLIAVAARALAVAIDPPLIDASDQAILHMEDDATQVLPIVGDTGVLASPVRSAWQTDSMGLRFRLPVSWVLRAPAVAWTNPTAW